MAAGKHLLENLVDEGAPQDWGEPEELPEVNDYMGPAPWAFGNWRFVVIELTADERVALTTMAGYHHRSTDEMAAVLVREALAQPGRINRNSPDSRKRRARYANP